MKSRIILIGLSALCALCGVVHAQTSVIALTSEFAPASPGATFEVFFTPSINDSGDIAFTSWIDTAPGNPFNDLEEGVWSTRNGSLELIQREGFQAPGTNGLPYVGFESRSLIGNDGNVSFQGTVYVDDGTVNSTNSDGLWQGRAGSSVLLARASDLAPGAGDGVFSYIGEEFTYLNDSQLVMLNRLAVGVGGVASDTDRGIWIQTDTGFELVHREGDIAPGISSSFGNFYDLVSNGSGKFAFMASIQPSAGSQNGIWRNSGDGSELIARTGSVAPDTGGQKFEQFTAGYTGYDNRFVMNKSGAVAFKGRLNTQGPGVDGSNDTGIWSDHGGELGMVVRESQPAPGTNGSLFADFRTMNISMNDSGRMAFNARIYGGDIDFGTNGALYVGDKNGVELVVREGDEVPGSPGAEFRGFSSGASSLADDYQVGINNNNDIAFIADIRLPGARRDSTGLWAYSSLLDEILPIAVVDSLFDVSPAQDGSMMREVAAIHFDAEIGFNDLGQLTYFLDFHDGSEGVFVTTVPAPGVISLGMIFGICLHSRRGRRD